jgi:hypothetical protein
VVNWFRSRKISDLDASRLPGLSGSSGTIQVTYLAPPEHLHIRGRVAAWGVTVGSRAVCRECGVILIASRHEGQVVWLPFTPPPRILPSGPAGSSTGQGFDKETRDVI